MLQAVEPFNIKGEVKSGLLDEQGFIKRQLNDSDGEQDAWFSSMKNQQEELQKKEQQEAIDSSQEENESDDNEDRI